MGRWSDATDSSGVPDEVKNDDVPSVVNTPSYSVVKEGVLIYQR